MLNKWFVIVNPTSGNGAAKTKWPKIYDELIRQKFIFEFSFTDYEKHSIELVQKAIERGFTKFISVGGDGTLHNVVNGILKINPKNISSIKIGIIPIGTGNDWVKTYRIPKDYKKAIKIIRNEKTIQQDIGKIIIASTEEVTYFINLAGIGFDAYVVNKVKKFKYLGMIAYLFGGLVSLTGYKKSALKISFNNIELKNKTLMFLIGICTYTGGGLQLTKNPNPIDGLFDISYVPSINLFNVLLNISNLFNGKITNKSFVNNYKSSHIKIEQLDTQTTYIQADGEIIGSGNFSVFILKKRLNFIIL
jgi:YegS/Rv2252/BmrU family lipid kinase